MIAGPDDASAFVLSQTKIAVPPLTPEIRLHLATEVTPLWQATEATLERNNLPPPYWAFAWPGGQALARYILDNRQIALGRRVFDFAAGCGVAAIAAALAGAAHTSVSEIDRFALAALRLNARLNGVALECLEGDLTAPGAANGGWNLVLAGDVFYEKPMAMRVEPFLRALARAGATVLVADPGRAYLPQQGLKPLTRYHVPTPRDLEDRDVRETAVYELMA